MARQKNYNLYSWGRIQTLGKAKFDKEKNGR